MKYIFFTVIIVSTLFSCGPEQPKELPIIGRVKIEHGDTIHHTIRSFEYLNQDSQIVNNKLLADGIYVADFFFTYCPTICPKVTSQMLRIHDKFKDQKNLKLVSFALDPKRDTIQRLHDYAEGLGVTSDNWHFLYGDKDEIFDLAEDYFSIALDDDEAPGGINHSGKLILVDQKGQVRSFCEGTIEGEVDKFMKDIELLLRENL